MTYKFKFCKLVIVIVIQFVCGKIFCRS